MENERTKQMARNNTTIDRIQAIWNMIGGDEMADLIIEGRAKLEVKMVKFIDWISTVIIPGSGEKFVAKEKFRLKGDGGICSDFCENFKAWFLAGESKIEGPVGKKTFRYGALIIPLSSRLISRELGGEKKSVTSLAGMFHLMSRQPNCEKAGVLDTFGFSNIFLIPDINKELRVLTVRNYPLHDGWSIKACSIDAREDWCDGCRVFSQDSKVS